MSTGIFRLASGDVRYTSPQALDVWPSYGLATVRYPVLEVTARVEPFENGRGFSLRVLRAGRPRIAAKTAMISSRDG